MTATRKIHQCPLCGVIMATQTTTGVCADCWEKDEKLYNAAISTLKFGERVFPEELSAKSGIDIKHIQRWIRQGRFGGH